MLIPLRGSEPAMQDGDALLREARHQSTAGLRCQADLRHQYQRRASCCQGALNEPHIHLGFAGTSDTKEKVLRKSLADRGADRFHYAVLRSSELRRSPRGGAFGAPLCLYLGAPLRHQNSR